MLVKELSSKLSIEKLFAQLESTEGAVFLDSSLVSENTKLSLIAWHPYIKITSENGHCYVNDHLQTKSFNECLDELLLNEQLTDSAYNHVPFLHGYIGYYSYEYGTTELGLPSTQAKLIHMPEALFYCYDCLLVKNLHNDKLYFISHGKVQSCALALQELASLIVHAYGKPLNTLTTTPLGELEQISEEEYITQIKNLQRHMENGDIYVCNLTHQLVIKNSNVAPYDLYKQLRQKNPAPMSVYANYKDYQVVSTSMENFFTIENNHIRTRPIKGTRPRGFTLSEDQANLSDLQNSPKEHSELMMIVDLERNDLNHICQPGTVTADKQFNIEEYATVFQQVATVEGDLRPNLKFSDIVKAIMPGGSITGTPKYRAIELLQSQEKYQRQLYTGAFGYIDYRGKAEFSIVIRTAIHQQNNYYIGVGGGLTVESIPHEEYIETLQKGQALVSSLLDK